MQEAGVLYNTYWVRFGRGQTIFEQAVENFRTLFGAAAQAGVGRIVHFSVANTNLHKITLNAGTSYNMKRRGDLRNDLAISIVRANDSCDDQRFISGSGDFIQYDAEDENDGSEFTPILHHSALNTRSDTDTDTGTSECYIIEVEYLHGHDQKFGPYSILVTEN